MDFPITVPKRKKAFSLFLSLSFLFLITFYITSILPSSNHPQKPILLLHETSNASPKNCAGVRKLVDHRSKCVYVKSNKSCNPKGYLNYLEIFYCTCTDSPSLGYFSLLLWLVVLFYVLGNTTSEYFCPSVESLSRVLKLSPTIAGTTLLPLGNGANDVFASIISFTRSGDADVGLNSVLGGAFFISCFVVGIVSISISSRRVKVDRASFVRDVLFFLFVLCCLLMIVIFGRINFWFALCFVCVYVVYIGVVSVMHLFCNKEERMVIPPVVDEIGIPLLGYADEEKGLLSEKDGLKSQDQELLSMSWLNIDNSSFYYYLNLFVYVLELPLSLPRKLTIPVVSEDKWSKPFAASSATLAPSFFAAFCNKLCEIGDFKISLAIYSASTLAGIILGALTLVLTKRSDPPKRFLILWLAGGFLMSIVWTYMVVEELVSLLVAFGHILGISTSILGLTVLAWGNSLGDLISNMAMALKGGPDGAQVALSGCYAGPLFNTLMGLGLSLVFASWENYPWSYPIPRDYELYETVGFLMGGLLWALVILPKTNMQLDKSLGVGLLAIYFCFLFLRLVKGVGLLKLGA
ncbi:cation/calcium exchanger 1 [Phtheirospermum japonicum]|uniref:Cation/calcium exchanger 1 n=1 Tax=Phtheirospermum japonicum TaxID=374723 RepID=A0A830B587_9LAMI|nr:cation/calcium exchanger 1 [Phtheirospermum japonicum]